MALARADVERRPPGARQRPDRVHRAAPVLGEERAGDLRLEPLRPGQPAGAIVRGDQARHDRRERLWIERVPQVRGDAQRLGRGDHDLGEAAERAAFGAGDRPTRRLAGQRRAREIHGPVEGQPRRLDRRAVVVAREHRTEGRALARGHAEEHLRRPARARHEGEECLRRTAFHAPPTYPGCQRIRARMLSFVPGWARAPAGIRGNGTPLALG